MSSDNGSLRSASVSQKSDYVEIDLIGSMLRNWRLTALCGILGATAAIAYAFITPTIYESEAEIMVIPKNETLPMENLEVTLGFERPDSIELLATHAKVLKSRRIVMAGLKKHGLLDLPSVEPYLSEKVDQYDYVILNTYVTRGGEGAAKTAQVLNVGFKHPDASESAQILSAVIEAYQGFIASTAQSAGSEAAELISRKSAEISDQLRVAEDNYREFREQAPVLFHQGQSVENVSLNVHQTRVADLEKLLSDLQLRRTAATSRLEIVNDALLPENAANLTDIERFALIDQADIERLTLLVNIELGGNMQSEVFLAAQPERAETARTEYGRLIDLKLEASAFSKEHPRYAQLKGQIDAVEKLMAAHKSENRELDDFDLSQLTSAYQKLLEHDIRDIDERIVEHRNLIESEREKAKSLISYEIREKQLGNEVMRAKTLYDAVIDRLREINLAKDYGGFITEVIRPVEVGRKVWPKKALLAVLGLLGGVVLGSVLSVLRQFSDKAFHSVSDIESTLELSLITNLPQIRKARRQTGGIASTIVAHHSPGSIANENIRQLRTFVLRQANSRQGYVLQFTSALPGDGKTTVSTNLAVSLCQSGKRVLLIDADIRRPSIGSELNISPSTGFADVLRGDAPIEDAVVDHPEIEGLHVLAGAQDVTKPTELISTSHYPKMLGQLRDQFDVIIVDSPPILSVVDPVITAEYADGVILVLRLDKESRAHSTKAVKLLKQADIDVLGLVLNSSNDALTRNDRTEVGYGFGTAAARSRAYYHSSQQR